MPRRGGVKNVRWFKGPGRWSFHTMNAFEEGSRLHIDLTVSEINGFAYLPSADGKPWNPQRAKSCLTRWTVDLAGASDTFSERRLWDTASDFYKTDPRVLTRPYRHGFMAARDTTRKCRSAQVHRISGKSTPLMPLIARFLSYCLRMVIWPRAHSSTP